MFEINCNAYKAHIACHVFREALEALAYFRAHKLDIQIASVF